MGADQAILHQPTQRGHNPKGNLREILDAARYLARTGSGWRMPPQDFGAWQSVDWWFRRFVRRPLFQTLHDVALMLDHEQAGREASPTAGVVDSQTEVDLQCGEDHYKTGANDDSLETGSRDCNDCLQSGESRLIQKGAPAIYPLYDFVGAATLLGDCSSGRFGTMSKSDVKSVTSS
jgi:transposase